MRLLKQSNLLANTEFQSALVRLGVWLFAVTYVSAGALSERYAVDMDKFTVLFATYLVFFSAILISIFFRATWEARRYFSLAIDISATTWCIYLTGEASNPFFLLYIWIFVSYGSRYGRKLLRAASILSVFAYSMVLTAMGQWQEYLFEASFVLLVLVFLPVYQYLLMNKLHNAKMEAENSNHLMGRFLSHITNDMRSPLVDIISTANSMNESGLSLRNVDRLERISSSAILLDTVIGDILDFSKLEAHQIKIQSVPFDLQSLLVEVCSITNRLAPGKEFISYVSHDVPKIVLGDEQRLRQVLVNVLKTAIRNSDGNELRLSVELDVDEPCVLLFEIDGVGKESEKKEARKFRNTRSEWEHSQYEQSPYLGVSLGRRLMQIMGGELGSIWGESGSIFWLRLPVGRNEFESNDSKRYLPLQGKKVFLFETNSTSREAIIKSCEQVGMIVESVDKVGVLSQSISESTDSSDTDVIMVVDPPGGQDVGRIADICLEILGKDLPLVVLSSRRDAIDPDAYENAVVISKPFILEYLLDALNIENSTGDKSDYDLMTS